MKITSKYRSLSIQARAAAVANVVLNFIFIRIFGYVAAGYTTLACYILYSVGTLCGEQTDSGGRRH